MKNFLSKIFYLQKKEKPKSTSFGCGSDELRRLYHYDCFSMTKNLNGSIVECGVAQGLTVAFYIYLLRNCNLQRNIWAIDSFNGFPQPQAQDGLFLLKNKSKNERFRKYSVDYVKEQILKNNIMAEELIKVKFSQGWIPSVFKEYNGEPVSLLNIDVDLYKPTIEALTFFWPLVQKDGIVMLDEYDSTADLAKWPGAKVAIDEFIKLKDLTINRHPSGRVYLKK